MKIIKKSFFSKIALFCLCIIFICPTLIAQNMTCNACSGIGRRICGGCNGSGIPYNNANSYVPICIACDGKGTAVCSMCYGKGCLGENCSLKMSDQAAQLVGTWRAQVSDGTSFSFSLYPDYSGEILTTTGVKHCYWRFENGVFYNYWFGVSSYNITNTVYLNGDSWQYQAIRYKNEGVNIKTYTVTFNANRISRVPKKLRD